MQWTLRIRLPGDVAPFEATVDERNNWTTEGDEGLRRFRELVLSDDAEFHADSSAMPYLPDKSARYAVAITIAYPDDAEIVRWPPMPDALRRQYERDGEDAVY